MELCLLSHIFFPGAPRNSIPFNDITDYCDVATHDHPQRKSEDIQQPSSLFETHRCRQAYCAHLDQKASRLNEEGSSVAAVCSGLEGVTSSCLTYDPRVTVWSSFFVVRHVFGSSGRVVEGWKEWLLAIIRYLRLVIVLGFGELCKIVW